MMPLLLLAGALVLTSCGTAQKTPESEGGAAGITEEGLIEDTHETEFGYEMGTESGESEDLIIEETEDEESSIVQADGGLMTGKPGKSGIVAGASSALGTGTQREDLESEAALNENSGSETALREEPESEAASQMDMGPFTESMAQVKDLEASGQKWSLAYEDLSDGSQYGYQEDRKMQSASVIKLFIMGAVYQYMCYPESDEEMINFGESYDGELKETITKMITVSDNDAANLLVEKLGGGDFEAGEAVIAKFCQKYGFSQTSLGRRFMASDLSSGDNETSAADVRKFYSDLYHGKLVNEEASSKMLEIVKGQTLKNKLPAGLPQGFTSGGKTGEMPDGYGLGCIENDSAIVFPPEESGKEGYILVALSNNLGGKNTEAQNFIRQISAETAAWYLNK